MEYFTIDFDNYTIAGDTRATMWGPFTLEAKIYNDDSSLRPDEFDAGIMPAYHHSPPEGSAARRRYYRHLQRARAVVDAWERGEWRYVGVSVSVLCIDEDGAPEVLGSVSLWGIGCNYPRVPKMRDPKTGRWRKRPTNSYLREVANDLAPEAIRDASRTLIKMTQHNNLPASLSYAELGHYGKWLLARIAGTLCAVDTVGRCDIIWLDELDYHVIQEDVSREEADTLLQMAALFSGDDLREVP